MQLFHLVLCCHCTLNLTACSIYFCVKLSLQTSPTFPHNVFGYTCLLFPSFPFLTRTKSLVSSWFLIKLKKQVLQSTEQMDKLGLLTYLWPSLNLVHSSFSIFFISFTLCYHIQNIFLLWKKVNSWVFKMTKWVQISLLIDCSFTLLSNLWQVNCY